MNNSWITEMSDTVSYRLGHSVKVENIYSDENGWNYYIPAKSLQSKHPLILNHYRGPLFMVIPHEDYKQLEEGFITVQEYIHGSFWNFGYFWGGGSMLNGVYWQPLEKEPGIHDIKTIRRYLTILKCRTNFRSSGYMPSADACAKCDLDSCPFSKYNYKGASWANEVFEDDDRKLLFEAVKERIYRKFGFEAVCCLNNTGNNTILMFPFYERYTVEVYLPESILVDMLYHPGKYDIEEIANSLSFELGIPFTKERVMVPHDVVSATEFCYEFWKNGKSFRWFKSHTDTVKSEKTDSVDEVRDVSIFAKISNFFKNLF